MFSKLPADDLDLIDIFNASANAYVIFTRDLIIAGCNDAYLKVVGRSTREEIVGRPLFEAFPADPQSDEYRILKTSFERVLATNQPDHVALLPYSTSRPGEPPVTRFWSATHMPLRNKRGELAYILQHTEDVTELQELRVRNARSNIAESGVLARAQAVQTASEKLFGEIALMRDMFEQAPGFIAVLTGPDHVFQLANDAYRRLVGRGNLIGRNVAEALPEIVGQGFVDTLDQVWRAGEPFTGQDMPIFLQWAGSGIPELRHVDFVYQPIRDAAGAMTGIFVQGHDVTERWLAQRDLQRQTDLLRLAQDGGGFGTYDWDLRRKTVRGSRLYRELLELPKDTPEDIPIELVLSRVHPEDLARMALLTDGISETIETPHELRLLIDGRVIWIGARGTIIRDVYGEPERILGAAYDLTQRKQIEERLDMVARESAHRVKNILTIMQIITENTLRRATSLEAARQSLGDRIAALNQAQIRILAGPKDSRLDAIVRDTFTITYQLDDRIVIKAEGDAELAPRTGLGVALALHELITNALKYGALSVPEGKVIIGWTLTPCPTSGTVRVNLDWREVGGPPVSGTGGKGFGSMLIRNSLAHDPAGRADWVAAPDGVRCQFVFTAKPITENAEDKAAVPG